MKKIFALIISLIFCLNLCSCTYSISSRISDFDALAEMVWEGSQDGGKAVVYDDDIKELCDKLQLNSKKCHIDEDFIREYLKTHTEEELFNNLYVVTNKFNKDILHTIISLAMNITEIESQKIDLTNTDAEGFYKEYSDNFPKNYTFERTGKFYNKSGGNVHYETKTCSVEYTYYGDFAIHHSTGYAYLEGSYGWENGTFLDSLPGWEYYDDYVLECRGNPLFLDLDSAKELTYISVGDCTYIFGTNSEDIFGGAIWIKCENNFDNNKY